ncbi:hypothetical protein GCM10009841_27270 [Microlunatus panaciterrae]|uniref:CHASE2 domain-containing sensor protein n=1 Tax=Microlunatus panaciterrae TaxID=400768 RepID=A0ABS2RHA6_9ACTN|nr:hypothetical protein [Microlunatus panaciterrae]MBM7798390.1 CHASE2 domain-containing sensor protein [Microlunatus panaciterrae]
MYPVLALILVAFAGFLMVTMRLVSRRVARSGQRELISGFVHLGAAGSALLGVVVLATGFWRSAFAANLGVVALFATAVYFVLAAVLTGRRDGQE